jgi:hypothetical protein
VVADWTCILSLSTCDLGWPEIPSASQASPAITVGRNADCEAVLFFCRKGVIE